ncbi:MAG: DinB family protein [Saprospiraceae bacterium]|nr:DinB family protein [Saprospiraceae bacterium]
MALSAVRALFRRDLNRLKSEIQQYKKEERIWHLEKNIPNTAGNLCLHIVGNLNAYIGAEIGKTGYIRKRDLEFSQKNVARRQLIEMVENTISVVDESLDKLSEADLQKEYPLVIFEDKMSVEFFLIHLTTHLGYHLGQINYHRRLLDE